MPNTNNEGFAIAPQADCANGLKPVVWADDDRLGGVVLQEGTINCTDLPPTTTNPDTDGDGVLDPADGCPTAAGPASNNGCPLAVTPPSDDDPLPSDDDKTCENAKSKLQKAKAKLKKLKRGDAPKKKIKGAKSKVKKAKDKVKKAC